MEPNPTFEAVDALTADLTTVERAKLAETITDVLAALPPADGPLDAGIRRRLTDTAHTLTALT